MDVKKIGRIPKGGGWRLRGREVAGDTSAHKQARTGYDYVHSVVDDHSRFAYTEVLSDETGGTTAAFFDRALTAFRDCGVQVQAVMTDNAWNYTRSNALALLLEKDRIEHVLIRPHCPWQERQPVERSANRTLQVEWAYRQPFTSLMRNGPQPSDPGSSTTTIDVSPQRSRRSSSRQSTVTNLKTEYI